MKRLPWETSESGHFAVAVVQHRGESSEGIDAFSLQMVDVAPGWSERVALLGKGQQAMEAGLRRILARCPFPVNALHPDHGSEFFKHQLVRFWGEALTDLKVSRSRPSQKHDHRFVEPKNATLVRQYCGTLRLETPEHVKGMHVLSEKMWVSSTFFQPGMHVQAKMCQGDKVIRQWDQAQTPFQRLIVTACLQGEQLTRLQALDAQTNPMTLRKQMYRLLAALWELPASPVSVAERVLCVLRKEAVGSQYHVYVRELSVFGNMLF